MEKYICVDSSSTNVLCIGTKMECLKYVRQLESIDEKQIVLYPYTDSKGILYDGYDLVYIKDADIIMTEGEISMMQKSCMDERKSLKYIEDELRNMLESDMFSYKSKDDINAFLCSLEEMKIEQTRYINDNLFYNLDIDALRYAYIIDRENKNEFVCWF